jgi:hypothetical protein
MFICEFALQHAFTSLNDVLEAYRYHISAFVTALLLNRSMKCAVTSPF